MKTQLWAMDSHLLPLLVRQGFPMSSTLVQPILDSPPASLLVSNHFPWLHTTSPFAYAQGFPKHTCVLGAAGQGHMFWGAVCTLSWRKWRSGALQCKSAPEPRPFHSMSLGTGPCNRPHPHHLIFTAFPTLWHFTGPIKTSSFSVL